ncbi:MAG: ABC-type transport auxiliary lipoprotein family protein [Pseudomonadota bacterium]|nr:ABC-type transport auxiliary lipoprotein family protein [Pseudomonadota bacterium]
MTKYTFIALMMLGLWGCSLHDSQHLLVPSFEPSQQGEAFYQSSSSAEQITLRRVAIPPYLDRQFLIALDSEQQIEILHSHQWIEPLEKNLRRILAQDLNHQFQQPRVVSTPNSDTIGGVIIDLEIQEWIVKESSAQLVMTAVWRVQGLAEQTQRHELKRLFPVQYDAPETWPAAYQKASHELSKAIFSSIQ